jgi:hypothetical protein
MNSWLHSAGHRENILTPEYRDLGVGYLPGQTFLGRGGVALWSQQFGRRTLSTAQAAARTLAPVNAPRTDAAPVRPLAKRKTALRQPRPLAPRKRWGNRHH